jgi:hypothetical protein
VTLPDNRLFTRQNWQKSPVHISGNKAGLPLFGSEALFETSFVCLLPACIGGARGLKES